MSRHLLGEGGENEQLEEAPGAISSATMTNVQKRALSSVTSVTSVHCFRLNFYFIYNCDVKL